MPTAASPSSPRRPPPESGSGVPNKTKVATISQAQLREIAEKKMPDLTAATIEAAMSQVAGTCRSMGVVVSDT